MSSRKFRGEGGKIYFSNSRHGQKILGLDVLFLPPIDASAIVFVGKIKFMIRNWLIYIIVISLWSVTCIVIFLRLAAPIADYRKGPTLTSEKVVNYFTSSWDMMSCFTRQL